MKWTDTDRQLDRHLHWSIEVDTAVESAFALWRRIEDLPLILDCIRRVMWVDDRRALWDADILGRQVVWEARIVESTPNKTLAWESIWGTPNAGIVHFEPLSAQRTRMTVEISFQPRGFIERLGVRFGILGTVVQRDLERFKKMAEGNFDKSN